MHFALWEDVSCSRWRGALPEHVSCIWLSMYEYVLFARVASEGRNQEGKRKDAPHVISYIVYAYEVRYICCQLCYLSNSIKPCIAYEYSCSVRPFTMESAAN